MATWGMHIRIAEGILKHHKLFSAKDFLVGSIGPDCGQPNEDWSVFTPAKQVSHWLDSEGQIQAEDFYNTYLGQGAEPGAFDFYWGYYIHLLTDMAWTDFYNHRRLNDPLYRPLDHDPKFIWTIKKDWYDLDHIYFRDKQDGLFHKVFLDIESYASPLDYYPKDAISRQIAYIQNFYGNHQGKLDRPMVYLSQEDMDAFVDENVERFIERIENDPSLRAMKGLQG